MTSDIDFLFIDIHSHDIVRLLVSDTDINSLWGMNTLKLIFANDDVTLDVPHDVVSYKQAI